MFTYTTLVLIALITFMLIVQLVFLEKWYYASKLDKLEKNIELLAESLTESYDDYEKSYYLMDLFMEENSAIVNYIDSSSMQMFDVTSMTELPEDANLSEAVAATVINEEGQFYSMPVQGLTVETIEGITIGDEISVEGRIVDDSLFPSIINDTPVNAIESGDGFAYNGKVIIAEIYDGSATTYDYAYEYFDKQEEHTIDEGFSYFIIQQPFSKIQSIVFDKEMVLENGKTMQLYIESSLQSVDEVMDMMIPFYIVFYIVALLIVLLFAHILSNRMAKPIIAITDIANQMSELDFTQRIESDEIDELGQLARSINGLSNHLDHTMTELKGANNLLMADIEKERKLKANQKDFVANVSHELKTPISIARGYVEAIKDGVRPDRHEDYLNITLKELARMNDTVVNMLRLIKYEDTQKALEFVDLDARVLIEEIGTYFEVILVSKGMKIKMMDGPLILNVDSPTFRTLMVNLISNAVNYGVDHSEVCIECEHLEDGKAIYVKNVVADPDHIDVEKIWYKFYTVDRSHNNNLSGTGLGLPIVRSILERYESEYSAYIEGNEFVFRFIVQ